MRRAVLICWTLLSVCAVAGDGDSTITVRVRGVRSDKGEIMCSVHANGDSFPKADKALARAHVPAKGPETTLAFPGLSAGRYAVSCFHDENGNGKMDTNFLGIPKEGYGSSNDAKANMGPPKFADAAFAFDGHALTVDVPLHY
jgi:uncharacterized protein (DUF2141 family)